MTIVKKNIDKENCERIVELQARLMTACLSQGMNLNSNVIKDEFDQFVLIYGITFPGDSRVLFGGQTRTENEPHYQHMFTLLSGTMVSEMFPPAGLETKVSYWKRHLITDIDVTDTGDERRNTPAIKTLWVGYDQRGGEVARISDGALNLNHDKVSSVNYATVPGRGTCVYVESGESAVKLTTRAAYNSESQGMAQSSMSTAGTAPFTSTMSVSANMTEVHKKPAA